MIDKFTHNYLYYNDLFISLKNPEVKRQPTGLSTFAIRTSCSDFISGSQRTDQKLQKSFLLTDTKSEYYFFLKYFKNIDGRFNRQHQKFIGYFC